jgi:hypothetical protein
MPKSGARVKTAKAGAGGGRRGRSRVDEARDILASVVLCHIPVVAYDFQQKARTPARCSVIFSAHEASAAWRVP